VGRGDLHVLAVVDFGRDFFLPPTAREHVAMTCGVAVQSAAQRVRTMVRMFDARQ
jgi:hypothetical protein